MDHVNLVGFLYKLKLIKYLKLKLNPVDCWKKGNLKKEGGDAVFHMPIVFMNNVKIIHKLVDNILKKAGRTLLAND